MLYQEHLPHPKLRNHIKCYWTVSISRPTETNKGHSFLAEGLELSFNLGDPIGLLSYGQGSSIAYRDCVCGPMTQPMRMRPTGRVELLGVCFRPGGAYAFFPYPAGELVDGRGGIEDFWGSKGSLIGNGIRDECRTTEERIHLLEHHFVDRLNKSPENDSTVAAAICEIESHKGQVRICRLAKSVSLSSRQLERRFKERVGLSPKQLCRSLRFKNVFKVLAASSTDSWVSTALKCGYYDQSHMIREFKHFTGVSPAIYFIRQAVLDGFYTGNF